jgi:hypothetical protein
MSGVILIPKMFGSKFYVTDRYMCLFEMIRDKLGYRIIISNTTKDIPKHVDIIIAFKSPQHSNPETFMDLVERSGKTKIVGYFSDIHSFGNKIYERNISRMLERCDVIICPYDEAFRDKWPQYRDKYIFFPQYFAPHERYATLPFNKNPVYKCLLSGSVAPPNVYPIRMHIKMKGTSDKVTVMNHPGYRRNWFHELLGKILQKELFMKESYAEEINRYFCSVATSSIYRYIVAKYFEIPAAGTLLLANETDDLKKLGFVPFRHYVPITHADALSKINECLSAPQHFTEIRKQGMHFVRNHHSVNNRFSTLKDILENGL